MLKNIFGDWSKYIDTRKLNIITSQLSILYKIVGREVLPKKQEVFKAFKFCQCKVSELSKSLNGEEIKWIDFE